MLKSLDIARIFRHILRLTELIFCLDVHVSFYMSRRFLLIEFKAILGKLWGIPRLFLRASRFPDATDRRVFSLPVVRTLKDFPSASRKRMRAATYLAAQNGNVVKAPVRRGSSSSSSSSRRRSTSPHVPRTATAAAAVAALLARK